MDVKVVSVGEGRVLGQNNTISTVIVVKYMVGSLGPFTLQTTQAELNNGKAAQAMQAFAATLGTLPGVNSQ